MTGRATVTAGRRRSPPANAPVAVAVAVAVVLTAACGSGSDEPADSLPDPGTAATTTSAAAPTVGANAAAPTAGGSAGPAPPEVSTQPAAPLPPATSPPRQQLHLDTSGMRTFPGPEVWEALRQCQSQGDYGFVHPSGEYFGAYQFTVATWDRLANQRYTELLGILPSEAAPADQDRMAYYLWIESGHARWPACSHVFTGDAPSAEPAAVGADPAATSEATGVDEGLVAGVPFEPAPGDDEVLPPVPEVAETPEPGVTVTTTTSPRDLPALEIDPSVQPAMPLDVAGFPTPAQWEGLRFCESSGNYRAVSPDGRYYGAYQFWPDTWDFVANRNYPRLVGVLPSAATPQDQDRMAYRLWEERGDQPWPVCGRYLRPGA